MFGFQLGREWKLSLAELSNVFQKAEIIYSEAGIVILDNITEADILESVHSIGGTIKIFQLQLQPDIDSIYNEIITLGKEDDGKFKYSINMFGDNSIKLESILKKTKYLLKNNNISSRYFNKDNGKNLSSAQILGNSILKKGFDFNIVDLGGIFYFGKTIWVQDIDAYSKRDFEKETDMQVGMLPPKLCQMMINIGRTEKNNLTSLYDPFVGLGTIGIEALNMGFEEVFGSDISSQMVETASINLENFIEQQGLEANYSIIKLNAKFIDEAPFFSNKLDLIVSEGYLGEVMTKKNITKERIDKQKESLKKLYESFFLNLSRTKFDGTIVMCFPFWELHSKYIYFNEIIEIFEKNNIQVKDIFKDKKVHLTTKTGSLLYKRGNQLVGREIFKLTIKK